MTSITEDGFYNETRKQNAMITGLQEVNRLLSQPLVPYSFPTSSRISSSLSLSLCLTPIENTRRKGGVSLFQSRKPGDGEARDTRYECARRSPGIQIVSFVGLFSGRHDFKSNIYSTFMSKKNIISKNHSNH